jgi:hypothetical protein
MAHARTPVDGRNEGQEGVNVDVPKESLGMARLTIPHLLDCSF